MGISPAPLVGFTSDHDQSKSSPVESSFTVSCRSFRGPFPRT